MYIRVKNSSVNIGKMYFENTYTIVTKATNVNVHWLTKQNGISCGIIKDGYCLLNRAILLDMTSVRQEKGVWWNIILLRLYW